MRTQPYRPAADVQVELEATGGAIDDPERLLSLMITKGPVVRPCYSNTLVYFVSTPFASSPVGVTLYAVMTR